MKRGIRFALTLALAGMQWVLALAQEPPAPPKMGHSRMGPAYDEGFRERPWRMEGIGNVSFPITTKVAEVQDWFNQGVALLHSFWYEEAERSFRWCLKLDPECAMAYWALCMLDLRGLVSSLATSSLPEGRSLTFLREAVKRRDSVSRREQMYIDATAAAASATPPERYTGENQTRGRIFADKLEELVLEFATDADARAFLGLTLMNIAPGYAPFMVLKDALRVSPDHPGAHHYIIHNWDGRSEEQALDSCELYGKLAPGVGHANHMPGHIYSGAGMWHEAAIWMDRATRVEKAYFHRRLKLPSETWNYSHNLDYLCYIQEQLGLASRAIEGARELVGVPGTPGGGGGEWTTITLARALVKFERWKEILAIPEGNWPQGMPIRAYALALAHIGLGDLEKAEAMLRELSAPSGTEGGEKGGEASTTPNALALEVEGLLKVAKGDFLTGIGKLLAAAEQDQKERDCGNYLNDPPIQPHNVWNVVGEAYLKEGSAKLALEAFERALANVKNDAFALSGLVRAHFALGNRQVAADFYARLLHVWSNADEGLWWMDQCKVLGLTASPRDDSPRPQRSYLSQNLDEFGPMRWSPYNSPDLEAKDVDGNRVSLQRYRGKNVLLIFFLGDECIHCLDQLKLVKEREGDFNQLNTVVLAISSQTPEQNKASQKAGNLGFTLLSDVDRTSARRFHSYDDFEDIELHSTIYIDPLGRIIWKKNGGDPFTDMDFLIAQIRKFGAAATPDARNLSTEVQETREVR